MNSFFVFVPMERVELSWNCFHTILSRACLPVSPHRHIIKESHKALFFVIISNVLLFVKVRALGYNNHVTHSTQHITLFEFFWIFVTCYVLCVM